MAYNFKGPGEEKRFNRAAFKRGVDDALLLRPLWRAVAIWFRLWPDAMSKARKRRLFGTDKLHR